MSYFMKYLEDVFIVYELILLNRDIVFRMQFIDQLNIFSCLLEFLNV